MRIESDPNYSGSSSTISFTSGQWFSTLMKGRISMWAFKNYPCPGATQRNEFGS